MNKTYADFIYSEYRLVGSNFEDHNFIFRAEVCRCFWNKGRGL